MAGSPPEAVWCAEEPEKLRDPERSVVVFAAGKVQHLIEGRKLNG
jgi:hypothetical protein